MPIGVYLMDNNNDDNTNAASDAIDIEAEREEGERLRNLLNPEQARVFEAVMNAVHDPHAPNCLFLLDAAAGSGKSFLFQTLISVLRGEDTPLIAMAPTGLTASLLKGGRTLHSRFKIPLDVNETTTTGVSPTSTDGRLIAAAKLIITDEISMVNKTIFDLVERGLRGISTDNRPFANKAVIIAGDFRQTLPALLNANRQTIVDSCMKGSRNFHAFQRHDLQVNVRTRGDEQHFSAWLIELGNGMLPPL
ncbi:hypothetical protein NQ314_015445 [Rhamnusium bicolor]|uniref:ATP-dependent DNA helicase n=1 Tax=Rhamnusium bicolor TaxID=1586634 RepID=A0AAV8WY18_9CUCU|nr:hypothetical protein NQ314_015445 [Rhamnusium bicolor]